MTKKNEQYLAQYMTITVAVITKIAKHCKRYGIQNEICAYYRDWNDFCSDWCSNNIGYTRTEARKLLHGGKGEFIIFKTGEIIRFVM